MKYNIKPSVTELLDILNKPALLGWANKIGLSGITLADARKKHCGDGISLHKQIERFIESRTPFIDADFQARFENFFSDKEIIQFEKQVSTDRFQGRLDIKFTWGGVEYICDFKSNQTGVYLENKLQLSAYRQADGCEKVAIISIPTMTMIDVQISDFSPYEKMIGLLADIYQLKKQL